MSEARESRPVDKDDAAKAEPEGLEAGGHEPAPASDDPVQDEARASIQDAFNELQALHPDHALGEEPDHAGDEPDPAKA